MEPRELLKKKQAIKQENKVRRNLLYDLHIQQFRTQEILGKIEVSINRAERVLIQLKEEENNLILNKNSSTDLSRRKDKAQVLKKQKDSPKHQIDQKETIMRKLDKMTSAFSAVVLFWVIINVSIIFFIFNLQKH